MIKWIFQTGPLSLCLTKASAASRSQIERQRMAARRAPRFFPAIISFPAVDFGCAFCSSMISFLGKENNAAASAQEAAAAPSSSLNPRVVFNQPVAQHEPQAPVAPNSRPGAGASHDEILADYPDLEAEDILAAIEYAAHQTDHVVLMDA